MQQSIRQWGQEVLEAGWWVWRGTARVVGSIVVLALVMQGLVHLLRVPNPVFDPLPAAVCAQQVRLQEMLAAPAIVRILGTLVPSEWLCASGPGMAETQEED